MSPQPWKPSIPTKLPSCHLTSYIGQSSMRMTSGCEGHGQGTWPAFPKTWKILVSLKICCEWSHKLCLRVLDFLVLTTMCMYIYIYIIIICKVQPQGQEFSSRAIFNALLFDAICGSKMVLSPSLLGSSWSFFSPAVLSRLSTAELSVHKTILNKNLGSWRANKQSCVLNGNHNVLDLVLCNHQWLYPKLTPNRENTTTKD